MHKVFGARALALIGFALATVSPQAVLAYSGNWDVNNPPGDKREARIDVREGTWMSLDVSPDGRQIAFDLLGDIYVMPVAGGEARSITQGLAWDYQPRFSPDGRQIAFTSDRGGGDNIWVMGSDGSHARQVTKESFRLLNNPSWSADGRYIAARKHFTTQRSLGTGEIWLYNIGGGDGVALVEKPSPRHQKELGEPAFSHDGRYVYYSLNVTPGPIFEYAQDSNGEIFNIRRYDMQTGAVETVVDGPGGAVRPEPSPDGKRIAYVKRIRAKSALFVKDLESGVETPVYKDLDYDMQETWAVQGVYPNMDWLPDNRTVIFWAGGKIRRVNVDTGETAVIPFHVKDSRTIVDPPRRQVDVAPDQFKTHMVRWAAMSPNGKSVVFESVGKLYVRDVKSGETRRLTRDKGEQFELYPSFSRDGDWIVFTTWDDTALGTVRKIRARGGNSEILTRQPGHYIEPRFSPDGKTVVFRKIAGGYLTSPLWSNDPGVYRMPATGGAATLVTADGVRPHYGASNDRIYVMRHENGFDQLISVNLDGLDPHVVATADFATDLEISPDSRNLAFRENYNVYLAPLPGLAQAVTVDTKSGALPVMRLSEDAGEFINWSPDGRRMTWTMGPTLFQANVADAMSGGKDFKPAASGIDLSQTVAAPKPSGVVVLTGARILTMADNDTVIENGVIVIEDNRIAAIGAKGSVNIPKDAKVVDVAGKTIMPGMVDAHAHGGQGVEGIIPQQNYADHANLAFGVTTIHDPANQAIQIFAAAELQRAGKILAPRIFSTGEIIYGAHSDLWARIDSLDDALHHVRRLKAQGALSVKNYNQPRREQRQQVIAAARAENMLVVAEGGALYHMDMAHVIDGNTGLEHSLPNAFIYDDVKQLWPQTKVEYTPTLVVGFGGLRGEDYFYQHDDVWRHPILSRFAPPRVLEPRSVRRQKAPEEDYIPTIAKAQQGKQLADLGVSVHTGAHGQREGIATHWEMWMFVMGGMSPMEAIAAATRAPASYLGLDRDVGSLEAGKLADLVILDANPLDDIRNTDKIDRVMLNGRLYDGATLNETVTGDRKTRPYFWRQ